MTITPRYLHRIFVSTTKSQLVDLQREILTSESGLAQNLLAKSLGKTSLSRTDNVLILALPADEILRVGASRDRDPENSALKPR